MLLDEAHLFMGRKLFPGLFPTAVGYLVLRVAYTERNE